MTAAWNGLYEMIDGLPMGVRVIAVLAIIALLSFKVISVERRKWHKLRAKAK